jgi:hypothetical protein
MRLRGATLLFGLAAASTLGLGACSGPSSLLERLDERAGIVLLRAREPLVFARTEPRYSRSMRDYLYVGPVETNRQGVREYYLWIGVATTLDRGFIAPITKPPSTLYITVQGEPIELALEPWHDLVRTASVAPVYDTAVPVRAELAARVTLHQLSLLDSAHPESVAVDAEAEGAARAYRRWERSASFEDFLDNVTAR